jgi:hypothetical protein
MMLLPDLKYFGADPPGEKLLDPGHATAPYYDGIESFPIGRFHDNRGG